MSQNESAAIRFMADQEASNEAACFVAAELAGLSPRQALDCDEGHRCCNACPWQGHGKWRQIAKGYILLEAVPNGHLFFREILTGDTLVVGPNIYRTCPEVLDPTKAEEGKRKLRFDDPALTGEQMAGNAHLGVWINAVLQYIKVSDDTLAAARRINQTEPKYQADMAEALGFETVGLMYMHQQFLATHGTPEYKAWAKQFLPEDSAC